MKKSSIVGLLPVLFSLAAAAQDPGPTPTPSPRRSRLGLPTPTPVDTPGRSDSLADVVRRSQEVRTGDGSPKKSLGVITNETLKSPSSAPSAKGKGGTVNIIATPKPGGAPAKAGPPAPAAADFRDLQGHTEAEWRRRAHDAHAREMKAEADVKKIEVEEKRLENDFYAWSDGNYRDRVIKPSWEKAKEELKKAHLDLDQAKAASADLEEEARKAGAPPGWLREK